MNGVNVLIAFTTSIISILLFFLLLQMKGKQYIIDIYPCLGTVAIITKKRDI